jgi:hypothetical protein
MKSNAPFYCFLVGPNALKLMAHPVKKSSIKKAAEFLLYFLHLLLLVAVTLHITEEKLIDLFPDAI